jgi:hypothetical protein
MLLSWCTLRRCVECHRGTIKFTADAQTRSLLCGETLGSGFSPIPSESPDESCGGEKIAKKDPSGTLDPIRRRYHSRVNATTHLWGQQLEPLLAPCQRPKINGEKVQLNGPIPLQQIVKDRGGTSGRQWPIKVEQLATGYRIYSQLSKSHHV